MITCEEAQKRMLLKASGELDAEKGMVLGEHICSCAHCADYHQAEKAVATAVREAMREQRPGRATVQAILHNAQQQRTRRFPGFFMYPVAAAAALLILAAGVWIGLRDSNGLSEAEKMHTIISLIAENPIEPLSKSAEDTKHHIEQLAGHLLSVEGLDWEQEATDRLFQDLLDEPDPTSLLWNNNPFSLQKKCG